MPRIGMKLPDVIFRTRVRDDSIDGPNPFTWKDMTTQDYFRWPPCHPVLAARCVHADMFDLSVARF